MIRTMVLAAVLGVGELSGQMALPETGRLAQADELVRVDSLYAAFAPLASLEAAEALAGAEPENVEVAWRAARAAVALGMLAREQEEEDAWFRRGERHAARGVAADSLAIDALFWLAAAKGKLAVSAGARDAARLGEEVWQLVHRMLALDPDHAGAHAIMGKLQYEVLTLTRVERFIARMILGENEAFRSSKWEDAERFQRRAVALEPEVILYRYDLAMIHQRRGRREDARAELDAALALPPHYPQDPRIQEDARRQLARLEGLR